jgi:uncharacterized DUF497 family protein
MGLLFEWDKDKAQRNLRKHKVSFDEAQTVLTDDYSITLPDAEHSRVEDRLIIIGVSNKNRLLVVAYTERDNSIRLISARKATPKERQTYEEEII